MMIASPHLPQISAQDRHEMEMRQRISSAVLAGCIDDAIALTDQLAPGCLEQHPELRYALQCQRFVELVRANDTAAALEIGQQQLWPYCQLGCSDAERTLLEVLLGCRGGQLSVCMPTVKNHRGVYK